MYIRTFSTGDLFYNGFAVPDDWTLLARGNENNTPQRLEFGPPDSHSAFLDDIKIGSENDAPIVTDFSWRRELRLARLWL